MKNYQGCFAKDFKEFLFVQDFVSFFVGVFFSRLAEHLHGRIGL